MEDRTRDAPDSKFAGYPVAGYPVVFLAGYRQSYPAGYLNKSTLNNKFLPEFIGCKFTRPSIHQYP